jgi:mRNA-degrading endonuclease RelE of RelBE toxin-antitoxin system
VTHRATPEFWEHYEQLPGRIQKKADQKFELLKNDPSHPSLHFKKITDELWSVRVGLEYRALGTDVKGAIVWFWIGHHADYDRILSR